MKIEKMLSSKKTEETINSLLTDAEKDIKNN
jgi:hypothetical protein